MTLRALSLALPLVLAVSACSLAAPKYAPAFPNVQAAKDLPQPLKVGTFTSAKPELDKVMMRGNTMLSPTGSFASYLHDAARDELKAAEKENAYAAHELTAVLEENEMDTSSFVTGEGRIAARFKLSHKDGVRFEKRLSATGTWPSSFIGAHAIPNAINAYPSLVERLLGTLYTDPEFINALK